LSDDKSSAASLLESLLTELIARVLVISPDEVTAELIHEWREKYLYPNVQIGYNSKYGHYNKEIKIITKSEADDLSRQVEAIQRKADDFLAHISTDNKS
jgi:hypothetical protein